MSNAAEALAKKFWELRIFPSEALPEWEGLGPDTQQSKINNAAEFIRENLGESKLVAAQDDCKAAELAYENEKERADRAEAKLAQVREVLGGPEALKVVKDALLAGRPNNHDRDGMFGEGAILTNSSTASVASERIMSALRVLLGLRLPWPSPRAPGEWMPSCSGCKKSVSGTNELRYGHCIDCLIEPGVLEKAKGAHVMDGGR